MKLLKKILIFILILVVALLIIAAILPRDMRVRQSKIVDAPVSTVYNLVNDFKTQPQWNPWKANDKTMKMNFSSNSIGKGATYTWTSENSGTGSQLITESIKNELVSTAIEFGTMGDGKADYQFEEVGDNKTKVTWKFKSESPYPMNLMNFYGKMKIKESFTQGLNAIANVAQDRFVNKTYNGYKINSINAEERSYIARRAEVPAQNINQFYTQQLPALYHKMQESGLESQGKPCILYYTNAQPNGNVDIAAGVQLNNDAVVAGEGLSLVNIKAGQAFEVEYQGDIDKVTEAHKALIAYMSDKGLLKKYPLIQEYVTDASKETDPSKWVTKVIYYVAE